MHPEFRLEVAHLEKTHLRMGTMIAKTASDLKESQTKVEGLKKTSSGYDDQLQVAMNAQTALQRYHTELEKAVEKPYFGRIDFVRDDEKKTTQATPSYYIGKVGLFDQDTGVPFIVDWRAAIAALYYGGELGDVMYAAPEGPVFGHMALKRQYMIEGGQLIDVFDKNIAPVDEFLNMALSQSKDNRLTDIVSTIQGEQNAIIREAKEKFLVVQGVAGSGKTTIVLHRMAYLLYNHQDTLKPEQVLMLMPNRLFLDYVSEVLPDLGVNDIAQMTFQQLAMTLQDQVTFTPDTLIEALFEGTRGSHFLHAVTALKTEAFKVHLDACVIAEETHYHQAIVAAAEAFKFEPASYVNAYQKDYKYLPLFKRLPKIEAMLDKTLKDRWDRYQNTHKDKLIKSLSHLQPNDKGRISAFEAHEQKMNLDFEKLSGKWDRLRQSLLPKKTLAVLAMALRDYAPLRGHGDLISELIKEQGQAVNDVISGQYLYLLMQLEGLNDPQHYAHIVVDEAQDYNIFQFRILQKINRANIFTIVGDINQGIRSYRGIDSWDQLNLLSPGHRRAYHEILTCYRSTKQIVEAANGCLERLPEGDRTAMPRPVLREGEAVVVESSRDDEDSVFQAVMGQLKACEGAHSVAVLTPDRRWSKVLHEHLSKALEGIRPVHLVDEGSQRYMGGLSVMPIYQAKGLEFDAVILIDGHRDLDTPLHHKMRYVAMTRALHNLHVIELVES